MTYPGGVKAYYTYDDTGRLLTVRDLNGRVSYIYHQASGLLVGVNRWGIANSAYQYIGKTIYGYNTAGVLV